MIDEQRKWKEELDRLRTELERAQRRGELAKASEIQYGRIPELEKKLAELSRGAHGPRVLVSAPRRNVWKDSSARAPKTAREGAGAPQKRLLREEVTEEDIAEVVSSWTHIPVSRLQEGEREKLVKLEEHLHQRVVDQERSDQSRFQRGASRPRRFAGPKSSLGSFIFLGPTGVGKTELSPGARRIFVRRRERHDPDRHERVHGETHGRAVDRRAAGLRRL